MLRGSSNGVVSAARGALTATETAGERRRTAELRSRSVWPGRRVWTRKRKGRAAVGFPCALASSWRVGWVRGGPGARAQVGLASACALGRGVSGSGKEGEPGRGPTVRERGLWVGCVGLGRAMRTASRASGCGESWAAAVVWAARASWLAGWLASGLASWLAGWLAPLLFF